MGKNKKQDDIGWGHLLLAVLAGAVIARMLIITNLNPFAWRPEPPTVKEKVERKMREAAIETTKEVIQRWVIER